MSLRPGALMELQAEALYRRDPSGRLLAINEPEGGPAPLLFLGRTAEGNLWRLRHDLPAAIVAEAEGLCLDEPVVADPTGPLRGYDAMVGVLSRYRPVRSVWRGPAYVFPSPAQRPVGVVAVDGATWPLLARWFPDFDQAMVPACSPHIIVADGAAVAICFSSRVTSRACEAGVETAPPYRGRGYAPAVAAAWAAAVQASGRVALYGTSWENLASQAVARKLGLHLYGEDISFGE